MKGRAKKSSVIILSSGFHVEKKIERLVKIEDNSLSIQSNEQKWKTLQVMLHEWGVKLGRS